MQPELKIKLLKRRNACSPNCSSEGSGLEVAASAGGKAGAAIDAKTSLPAHADQVDPKIRLRALSERGRKTTPKTMGQRKEGCFRANTADKMLAIEIG